MATEAHPSATSPQERDPRHGRGRDLRRPSEPVGPLLFCRGWRDGRLRLAALLVQPEGQPAPELTADGHPMAAEVLHRRLGYQVWRYEFALDGAPDAGYRLGDQWYPVNTDWQGDLRLAYVSCNGQEADDRNRLVDERNRLWRRLAEQHRQEPLHLLLHGGDQLYADEMLDLHPALRSWAPHHAGTEDPGVAPEELDALLGDYLFERYLELYSQGAMSRLMSTVPSLGIWDDHDICDGWGSRPIRQLDSPVGRSIFRAAREQYLLFQMASRPDVLPDICPDASGATLSWSVRLPGLRLVAPDLRSERRPHRVLGERGREALTALLSDLQQEQVLLLSSVPVMGPRLSLVEAVLALIPHAQKYEDDLRDQWQSRAHRHEWRDMLKALLDAHQRPGVAVAVLSGEIHLATRATMVSRGGDLHQLVSSGISHPPPPALYARLLGALARLGESPLPEHPIRLWPLPGRRQVYTAQRNYLRLARRAGRWQAWWELEHDGPTPTLSLN